MSDILSLLHDIGFTVPTGLVGASMVCFFVYIQFLTRQRDKDRDATAKDRDEHVKKWESMIETHKESVKDIIASNKDNMFRIMDTHQKELDRQFRLYERNTASLEALAHQLSILTKELR